MRVGLRVTQVTPQMKNRSILFTYDRISVIFFNLQAVDIDELLNPGHPVYFNYANIHPTKAPTSLKVFTPFRILL